MAGRAITMVIAILVAASGFGTASAGIWNVYEDGSGDAPFIQAAIDSAASGDTILVWAGEYVEDLFIEGKSLSLIAPEGSDFTTLLETDAVAVAWVEGDDAHEFYIEGFSLEGTGLGTAVALALKNMVWFHVTLCTVSGFQRGSAAWGSGEISHCVFSDNSESDVDGGGIYLGSHGFIQVSSSQFINNTCTVGKGGGIIHESHFDAEMIVRDCLFYGNEAVSGGAVWSADNLTEFVGNTVVQNTAEDGAVVMGSPNADPMLIEKNIFADNSGYGLYLPGLAGGEGCRCNDWWNNTGDEYNPDGYNPHWFGLCPVTDWETTFFLDPQFCDPGSGDFTVSGSSICLPENQPEEAGCGLIGAFGPGPGCPVSAKRTTWGQIKARHR